MISDSNGVRRVYSPRYVRRLFKPSEGSGDRTLLGHVSGLRSVQGLPAVKASARTTRRRKKKKKEEEGTRRRKKRKSLRFSPTSSSLGHELEAGFVKFPEPSHLVNSSNSSLA